MSLFSSQNIWCFNNFAEKNCKDFKEDFPFSLSKARVNNDKIEHLKLAKTFSP